MNKIDLQNKTVFITGSAGFIGSNLVLELLRSQSPIHIVGLDNMNDYYDVSIKEWRLKEIEKELENHKDSTYTFYKDDLANKEIIDEIFNTYKPQIVVNLGAQAGVRYSITKPDAYIQSNMIGFYNILEACRQDENIEHLVYASSSSVYGSNKKVPYSTEDKVDNPVSLYAATKKSNELMAHWSESPGKELILEGLSSITGEMTKLPLYGRFLEGSGMQFLEHLMVDTIEPTVCGTLAESDTEDVDI